MLIITEDVPSFFLKDHYKEGESSLDVLTSNSVLVTRQDRLNMDCKNSKRVIH